MVVTPPVVVIAVITGDKELDVTSYSIPDVLLTDIKEGVAMDGL
jgi:hypothetical protein